MSHFRRAFAQTVPVILHRKTRRAEHRRPREPFKGATRAAAAVSTQHEGHSPAARDLGGGARRGSPAVHGVEGEDPGSAEVPSTNSFPRAVNTVSACSITSAVAATASATAEGLGGYCTRLCPPIEKRFQVFPAHAR